MITHPVTGQRVPGDYICYSNPPTLDHDFKVISDEKYETVWRCLVCDFELVANIFG